MNMTNEQHFNDEPDEGVVTQAPDIGTLAVLNKSEIDQQIATAKKYPRLISNFRKEATQLATLDEATAAECIYALPRDGKTIEGPSARFAEIMNYAWGNTRAGARVVSEDGDFITAQGVFYDLEKNTAISYEVQRRIVDKNGRRFKVDMIGTTGNAASSIALRNAILKGIPKAIWRPIYVAVRKVVAGETHTLANRRDEAIKAFAIYGVTNAQIYAVLGVGGVADVTIDHMVLLKGILTAIQEGDTTPEQAFARPNATDAHAGEASQQKAADLANKYASGNGSASSAEGKAVTNTNPPQASEQSGQPSPEPPQESPAPSSTVEQSQGREQSGRGQRRTSGVPLDFGATKR